jgi:hypothetical protein
MKYSLIINYIGNDQYAVVMKSWELNEDGEQINITSKSNVGLTLQQAIDLEINFTKENG